MRPFKISLAGTRTQLVIAFLLAVACVILGGYLFMAFHPGALGKAPLPGLFDLVIGLPFTGLFLLLMPIIIIVWGIEANLAPAYGFPLHMFTNPWCVGDIGISLLAFGGFFLVKTRLKNVVQRITCFVALFSVWMCCGAYLTYTFVLNYEP